MKKSVSSGALWLLGNNTGIQIINFIFGVILARLLLPADFGLLVTVQIFTGFAGLLASGGIGQALIRSKTADIRDFQVVFTMQLVICIFIYIFFLIVSPWIADFFNEPLYIDLIRVSALSFILRPFNSVARVSLQREMNFKPIAITSVTSMLISNTATVGMALNGIGVWSLVIGGLLGSFLSVIALLFVTGTANIRIRFDLKVAKQHGSFGIKYTINEIISYFRHQTANIFISRFMGTSSLGLFNKANSLAKMPFIIVSGAIYDPVLRAMASKQDDLDHTRYLYFRSIFILTLYSLPIYAATACLAKPFIAAVYGEKWLDSAFPLTILSIAYSLYCVHHPAGAVYAALNRLENEIRLQCEVMIVMIIAFLIGLQDGIIGIAYAMLCVQLYMLLRYTASVLGIVNGNLRLLLAAILPGICVNILMLVSLATAHLVLLGTIRESSPVTYLIGMVLTGTTIYVAGLFYLPFKELKAEANRWKIKIWCNSRP